MSNVAQILIEYVIIRNVVNYHTCYMCIICAFFNVNFVFAERNIIYYKSKQIKASSEQLLYRNQFAGSFITNLLGLLVKYKF